MSAFAVIKLLLSLGPDVVKLIGELIKDIKGVPGADKDRKAAERVLFLRLWAIKHDMAYPYETQSSKDK